MLAVTMCSGHLAAESSTPIFPFHLNARFQVLFQTKSLKQMSIRSSFVEKEKTIMHTLAAYIGAAIAEIAGCYAFWAWLRLDKSIWWVLPGLASLALFAVLLTLIDSAAAGRAYAAY